MAAPRQDVGTLRRWFEQAQRVVRHLEAQGRQQTRARDTNARELASARASLAVRRRELEAAEAEEARP